MEQNQKPTRGVPVELDKTRYLRFPLKALRALRTEDADKSLGQILLLGLQGDDPSLTLDQVEELIDLQNIATLFEPVKKATGGMIDLSKIFKTVGIEGDPQTPSPVAGSPSA